MNRTQQMTVNVVADTSGFDAAMQGLTEATQNFGRVFTSTIARSIRSGRGLEDTLKNIGRRLADLALQQALKPLDNLLNQLVAGLAGGLGGAIGSGVPGFASGAAFSSNGVVPFARGGVVSSPALFNFGNRLGVMGEAGPEAIMPLSRGPDGKLGVSAGEFSGRAVNIMFNVQSPDIASFKKSEGQITSFLARALVRGQRSM